MDWELRLVSIYLIVCNFFNQQKVQQSLRKSPNGNPNFTDEEVMTIYLYCVLDGYHVLKNMHKFIDEHLRSWFPYLPKYAAFNHRLNFLMNEFEQFSLEFIKNFHNKLHHPETLIVLDSMPIMLSKGSRAYYGKVAKKIANFGYCSSKKLFYHGVKFHLFANYVEGTLPNPNCLKVTGAQEHDLTAVRDILENFKGHHIIADKAYVDSELKVELREEKDVGLYTPVKLSRSKKTLDENESIFSKIINSFRQSIEIFFSWISERTGIQDGSKIRSEKGLRVHIFGRFFAAMVSLRLQVEV